MKKSVFILLAVFWPLLIFGQKVPSNQILVYFNSGIGQESSFINGQLKKSAKVNSENLKTSLSQIGIEESMIEVALPEFDSKDTIKSFENGIRLHQPDMTKLYKIKFPSNIKVTEIINTLNKLPQVGFAHEDGKTKTDLAPNDTQYQNGNMWHLNNTATPGADIHALNAWDIYTGNSNNIIAILDYGVDIAHRDLDNKISGGDSGYSVSHGTHVAGIASAESNNNQDITGVDWNARLHPQRIDTGTSDADVYQAIVDAVNYSTNVKVLNNSWETLNNDNSPGRYSFTIGLAMAYAYNANRTIVAAMGNDEDIYPGVVSYPGGLENVISVGASDINDHIAYFSRTGSHIDVVAPGVNIRSTIPSNLTDIMSGTSMATPMVSGLVSLLVGYNSSLTVNDVSNIITLSADDINYTGDPQIGPGFDVKSGYGRINLTRALGLITAPNTLNQWSATSGSEYSVSSTYTMQFVGVSGLATGTYLVKRHEIRKNVTFPNSFYSLTGCWGRGINSNGFSLASPNYGMKFCDIVPGTLSTTGATLRTYVYEVWNSGGSYLGYYPTTPANASFAYSALGIRLPYLTGSYLVCPTNTPYTLNDLPSGCSVSWNKSSNITIVSSNSTSCTVVSNGNSSGWIEAIITGTINTTIHKDLWVGKFESTAVSGTAAVCPNSIYTYTAQVPGGHSSSYSYSWTYPSNWYFYSQSQNTITLQTPGSPQYGTVRVSITNCAGASGYSGITVYPRSGCGGYFMLFPNPASTEVTISVADLTSSSDDINHELSTVSSVQSNYSVKIYNSQGSLMGSFIRSGKSFSVPLHNLQNGTYTVEVSNGKIKDTNQLIIKRN